MIEDREYLKRELARIYSPHTREVKSAMKKLREDINRCPELVAALKQTRWNRNRNSYTARQVRLIAEYLCIDRNSSEIVGRWQRAATSGNKMGSKML